MKSLFWIVVSVFFLAAPISAQNTIQFMLRNSMTKSDLTAPQAWFFVTHRDSGALIGFNGFTYLMEGWAEGVGGISFYFIPWLNFSLYGGLETTKGYWHVAVDALFLKGNFSLYGWYEYGAGGKDGDFLYFISGYKVTSWFKPEIRIGRCGPTWKTGGGANFSIPKTPLSIEPMAVYNVQTKEAEFDLSTYLDF
jgi:hypothetical protein